MLPAVKIWASIGLLILGARYSHAGAIRDPNEMRWVNAEHTTPGIPFPQNTPCTTTTRTVELVATVYTTTTITCVETITIDQTLVRTVVQTTTLEATATNTISETATVEATETNTILQTATVDTTTTDTISQTTTIDITETSTTVQTTTTTTTETSTSAYDPCPTTCSVTVGTVELVFWPTGNTFTYPTRYVDTALDYTFTSPSVYMIINTIYGYDSAGRTGPSATNTIVALDLDEVSTIVPDSGATRQLSLSDLGTDCPLSVPPSVLATTVAGGPCDPILAAPAKVRSWASPCGACGNFGLFDPPYAVPFATQGLLPTTTVTEEAQTAGTSTPAATSAATTLPSQTSVQVSSTAAVSPVSVSSTVGTTATSTPSSPATSASVTAVKTAAAARGTSGIWCLIMSLFASVVLL